MGKNKRWKRLAKRIHGECFKNHYYCNDCKYTFECINKASWLGNYVGIRRVEKVIRKNNIENNERKRITNEKGRTIK